jgi:hypothetical protein
MGSSGKQRYLCFSGLVCNGMRYAGIVGRVKPPGHDEQVEGHEDVKK